MNLHDRNTATALVAPALSVAEAAETRRSIRRYEPGPVPREDLDEILRLTALAPSAFNVQPWRFAVVETEAVKRDLQAAANGQRQVGEAPAVLVLYTDMVDALATIEETVHPGYGDDRSAAAQRVAAIFAAKSPAEREQWAVEQAYIALGFLLLIARSFGYDTSAMLGFDPARVRTVLGLPAGARIAAMVAVGRRAEEGFPHHRHDVPRIARYY